MQRFRCAFFLTLLVLPYTEPSTSGNRQGSSLQGAAAIEHLRHKGQYESVLEAYRQAQYNIREAGDKRLGWNPAHGFSSRFDVRGLHLTVHPVDSSAERHYQSRVDLISIGYGEEQRMVTEGTLYTDEQRLTIARPQVTEWFINTDNGLEQGFTLRERPGIGDATLGLSLTLRFGGDLIPQVIDGGQRVQLRTATGEHVLDYAGLRAWDARGELVSAVMHTKDDQLVFHVADQEAQYPLTIDPTFTQQAYLKASNADRGDFFGALVSVSGDTLVVGARFEDSNATGVDGNQANNEAESSGAAYVFERSGTSWTQQAYLKASNTGIDDRFGQSVSISGDTLVIGANREDSNATGVDGDQTNNSADVSGAAYVFERFGHSWSQQAYLKASNTEGDDQFGGSISISGDTLVVGARTESSNSTGVDGDQTNNSAGASGAAYVFERNGTSWGQQAYLKATNTGKGDLYGRSVSISGNTLAVGALAEDSNSIGVGGDPTNNGGGNSGAAYVLTLTESTSLCNGLSVTVSLGQGDMPTSSADVILGTASVDVINALGGDDTVCGLGGNDIINAGGGDDWVDGGNDDDDIHGSAGNDILFGGIGDDVIRGGSGDDDIEGEEGDDTLIGQTGNDIIDGGDGVDDINGGGGNDTIFTGSGATVGSGVFVSGSGSTI